MIIRDLILSLVKYSEELAALENYFRSKSWGPLVPTQCELTYVNQMPLKDEVGEPIPKSFYFSKIDLNDDVTDFSFSLRKTIAKDGKPIGRLYVESATGIDSTGQP